MENNRWYRSMPTIYCQLPTPGNPATEHECGHLMVGKRPLDPQAADPCGMPATYLVLIGDPPMYLRRYRCTEHVKALTNRLDLDVSITNYRLVDIGKGERP